ncbi:MAG: fibronectin type III domain-containing protein, partial [Hymenobacteraceae bacterium]|nr:fibronectin type III domain-containing protein [Hymenobacteraceae bacterium]
RQFTNWRRSWAQIVPGNFGGNGYTDLLFYDAGAGTGEFYTTNGQGGINQIRQFTNWRRSWAQIVPGNFGGNGYTDLLFYDAGAGTGEFYTTNGQGGINQISQFTNWRTSWTHIVPGKFGGSTNFSDLLFYDASSGIGEFYLTDGQGSITLLRQHTDWPTGLRLIVPGDFGGSGFTDLLFYSGATGKFYTTDGQGGFRLLREHTDWRTSWRKIIPGQFGGSSFTNLNAPTGLQVTEVDDRKIGVSWLHQSGSESGFKVRYRGKRAEFGDHNGSNTVDRFQKNASLTGLRSGYDYTISVIAYNAAGESQASNEVHAATPSRTISVSKEGAGASAVFIVTGTGFTPGSLVVLRATSPQLSQVQFVETSGTDGKFTARQSIPCQVGLQITFTAFEDSDPNGTFANAFVTTCP